MIEYPHVNTLTEAESVSVRAAYLKAFVNTEGEWYQRHIGTLQTFSDGVHANGYLWDCLWRDNPQRFTQISIEEFYSKLSQHGEVYVLADDLSRERAPGATLWPFPPYSVARLPAAMLWQLLPALPADLYVFDASMSWTLILTHEHDAVRRLILSSTPS